MPTPRPIADPVGILLFDLGAPGALARVEPIPENPFLDRASPHPGGAR